MAPRDRPHERRAREAHAHAFPCRARVAAAAILFLVCATDARPAPADVTGQDVRQAVARGVAALKRAQKPDGSWVERYFPGGETCLATLALLQAGEPADSDVVRRAVARVRALPNSMVYVTSLKIMVLAAADPAAYRADLEAAARWLVSVQGASGLWHYGPSDEYDHSNSQFAMLGLHAAAQAGLKIAPAQWQKARGAWLTHRNRDGGWGYRQGDASYGSMTAAAVGALLLLGDVEEVGRERRFRNGVAPGCGKYALNEPLSAGLDWLGRHFRADANPGRGEMYLYYWLYAVERCGMLSGRRDFGRHDWYREGADFLVRSQSPAGMWTNEIANTAFALLFLAKGHKPLLIQKLKWSERDDAWNLDRHDLEHLTAFIGDKLGEPVAWQTVAFNAPLEDWLAAPMLYMQGHDFPQWSPEQAAKLRTYVERGGTLLAEACCGKREFAAGFRRFAGETFPETPLRALPESHPVYSALFELRGGTLEGIDLGCRTSVLLSPDDLSCLWEQADVPRLSESAFKLGTNIAAYATGRQKLRDRLALVIVPGERREPRAAAGAAQFDALRLAQVVYDGDWRPDANALVNFADYLRREARLDVVPAPHLVRLTDAELRDCPILYLSGHHAFSLSDPERTALAGHLRRGGTLLAEACCGRAEFDAAFRTLMAATLPQARLEPIPPGHELFAADPGFRIETVSYRPAALSARPGLREPLLEGIAIDGRLAVVYSPMGIGCGLDGHECYECRGLVAEDARRIAANVVLYALTH